jgi:hypothetical protein
MQSFLKKAVTLPGILLCTTAFAQDTAVAAPQKKIEKIEAGFDGMLGMSYGSKTFGINVGGPSLKYKFSPNFKVGAGAFPSLIIVDSKAYPRLAVSPIIEYRKWMLICPYYGYDTNDKQIWTFGLGYKFR